MRQLLLVLLCLSIAGASGAAAQETPPKPVESRRDDTGTPSPPPPAKPPEVPPGDLPLRDPTVPDVRFGPAPGAGRTLGGAVPEIATAAAVIPPVALRGLVVVSGRQPAAILDVGGTLYHVVRGSQITHVDAAGRSVTLAVSSIAADETRLTLAALGRTVVVR